MELGELCSQLNILDWAIVYDGWLRNNVPKRLITFMWRHPGGKLVISVVQMFYDELIPISALPLTPLTTLCSDPLHYGKLRGTWQTILLRLKLQSFIKGLSSFVQVKKCLDIFYHITHLSSPPGRLQEPSLYNIKTLEDTQVISILAPIVHSRLGSADPS